MSLAAINRKILELEKQMAAAAEAMDFETAATLRNEISRLRGEGADQAPQVRQPPPGEMGLGTHVPVVERPKGWVPPRKPDLKTNVKPRRKR
jgi:hypothetical protein